VEHPDAVRFRATLDAAIPISDNMAIRARTCSLRISPAAAIPLSPRNRKYRAKSFR
jgi:hypothetical protein